MAGSRIKIDVNFGGLIEDIRAAGGNVEEAAIKAAKKSAEIMQATLAAETKASGVPESIANGIDSEVNVSGNRVSCSVGWKLGSYDPRNPSTGYKAVFLNYGSPRRAVKAKNLHENIGGEWKTVGTDRGTLKPLGFIARAKKKAAKPIKDAQRETLENLLKGLGE